MRHSFLSVIKRESHQSFLIKNHQRIVSSFAITTTIHILRELNSIMSLLMRRVGHTVLVSCFNIMWIALISRWVTHGYLYPMYVSLQLSDMALFMLWKCSSSRAEYHVVLFTSFYVSLQLSDTWFGLHYVLAEWHGLYTVFTCWVTHNFVYILHLSLSGATRCFVYIMHMLNDN